MYIRKVLKIKKELKWKNKEVQDSLCKYKCLVEKIFCYRLQEGIATNKNTYKTLQKKVMIEQRAKNDQK